MNNRTGSIAKRLNAALVRRRFARAFLMDLVLAVLVIAVWCLTIESTYGGTVTNVQERWFAGYEWVDDHLTEYLQTDGSIRGLIRPDGLIFAERCTVLPSAMPPMRKARRES